MLSGVGILLGLKIHGDLCRLIGLRSRFRLHTLHPFRTDLSSSDDTFLLHGPFTSIRAQSVRDILLGQSSRARSAARRLNRGQQRKDARFGAHGEACVRVLVFEMAAGALADVGSLFADGAVEKSFRLVAAAAAYLISVLFCSQLLLLSSHSGCLRRVLMILHRVQLRSDGKINFIRL